MTRRISALTSTLFLLLALCAAARGRQADAASELWLIRARQLTDSLLKDADALAADERALLWARLAEVWWQDDSERAHAWMLKAVDAVADVPSREGAAERASRLGAARELLRIAASKDAESRARLLSLLAATGAPHEAAEGNANAEALVRAGVAVLKQDPKLAAELGAAALRAGSSQRLPELLWGLRVRDARLADALFVQALTAARLSYDGDLLNSLRYVAFTESVGAQRPIPEPPEALKVELLKVYLEEMRRETDAGGAAAACASITSFISPLLPHFERLLPAQAGTVRDAVTKCAASAGAVARMRAEESLRERPPVTADELLAAADKAESAVGRTSYRFRAAQASASGGDLRRAVEILDRIDADARKVMGGMWEKWRTEWAASLALESLKRDDLQGTYGALDSTPADLLPLAFIIFAQKLPRDESRVAAEEFISKARKGLTRAAVSDEERAYWYVALLKLYTERAPLFLTDVLKETVSAINVADKPSSSFDAWRATLGRDWLDGALPASMLENNDSAVLEIVGAIESPVSRSLARLALLRASIERRHKAAEAEAAARKVKPDAN